MMQFHGRSRCHGSDPRELGQQGNKRSGVIKGGKDAPREGLPLPETVMTAMVLRWQDGGCQGEAEVMQLKMEKRGIMGAEKRKRDDGED